MPKSVGTIAFSQKSYKNTRTKISATPYGVADIFMLEMGLERAAPCRRLVHKVSGGHFLARGRVSQISDAFRRDVDGI